MTGLGATGTGVTGIFGILLHLHMPLQYLIMMAISFGVSFAVTWVIWTPKPRKPKPDVFPSQSIRSYLL